MDKTSSIIIVDNDKILLQMLKEGLSSKGYQCETTMSAKAALEFIDETPFDIMITDVVMPDFDGFELTEKSKKRRPDMAVIIMTGFIDEFSYDKAIEAGASDFIKKPFTLKEMMERLKHLRLHEKLKEMSVTDELTGLYNRRGFFALAEHELKMASRMKRGIYLLFGDFDKLKKINDTFGHQEGDLALIRTADILRETFRESDIIARIGGDEFVVIPINADGNDVDIIIARLQKKLEVYNTKETGRCKLSLSIGITYYDPDHPCSIDELLGQADKSMYEQKNNKTSV